MVLLLRSIKQFCVVHIIDCQMLFYVLKEENQYFNFQLYFSSRDDTM